jgi:hypothetical protein
MMQTQSNSRMARRLQIGYKLTPTMSRNDLDLKRTWCFQAIIGMMKNFPIWQQSTSAGQSPLKDPVK